MSNSYYGALFENNYWFLVTKVETPLTWADLKGMTDFSKYT